MRIYSVTKGIASIAGILLADKERQIDEQPVHHTENIKEDIMSIITDIAKVHENREKTTTIFHRLAGIFRGTGEMFGFITSFLLFLVMGPFSVLAVIPALFSLCSEKQRMTMREPESC